MHKAQAALAVRSGDISYAVDLMKKSNDPLEIVSMINNSGVALVRMGQVERGKKCYANALKILENCEEKYSKVQVLYNIALAYARENALQRSAEILEKIANSEGGTKFVKARSLQARILAALKTGEAFVLGGSSPQSGNAIVDIPLAFLEERFGATPETNIVAGRESRAQSLVQTSLTSPEIESVLSTASAQNSKSVFHVEPTKIIGCMGFFFPTKQTSVLGVKLLK